MVRKVQQLTGGRDSSQMKIFSPRKNKVFLLAAVVAIAATFIVLRTGGLLGPDPDRSLNELVKEADDALSKGNASGAALKYKQALAINPKDETAKGKLKESAANLAVQAGRQVDDGNIGSAVAAAKEALIADPDNRDAQEIIDEHGEELDPEEPPPSAPWIPRDLDDPGATPLNVLPTKMPGYKITQSGWLQKPVSAGQTYMPRSPAIGRDLDRVFLTIAKYKTAGTAKARQSTEEELFNVERSRQPVNSHPAYFALFEEQRPDIFPVLATITWTRGKWFFSLQIVPLLNRPSLTDPSTQFKRGIAKDVARKLGY